MRAEPIGPRRPGFRSKASPTRSTRCCASGSPAARSSAARGFTRRTWRASSASRGRPVREALRRLAAEGLVDLFANRGARVATATDEQLRSSYETRLVVEPGAARMAAERRLARRIGRDARGDPRRGDAPGAPRPSSSRPTATSTWRSSRGPATRSSSSSWSTSGSGGSARRCTRRASIPAGLDGRPRRARVDRRRDRERRSRARPSDSRAGTSAGDGADLRELSDSVERGRALADLQRLQVGVEVERVVAALAADAADPDAAEGRGQVADQEGVDPRGPGADRAADPLGALGRAACRRSPRARRRSSWRARPPPRSSSKVWNVSTGPKTSRWTTSESLEAGSIRVGS